MSKIHKIFILALASLPYIQSLVVPTACTASRRPTRSTRFAIAPASSPPPAVISPTSDERREARSSDDFIVRDFEEPKPDFGEHLSVDETKQRKPNFGDALPQARPFPFSLIVNHDEIKHALLLASVNPNVGGVVISGGRGTAKSILARSMKMLLPSHIERIKGSLYNIDPSGRLGIDSTLRERLLSNGESVKDLETEFVETPFITVPLNVQEDSLLGTVDLEASIDKGRTVFSPGLLAKAHRGILYVDEVNLLDEEAANILLNVIADGYVKLEREGLSVRYPCKPLLIATFNPDEGELREHLLDRIGVSVSADSFLDIDERLEAVENVLGFSGGTADQLSPAAAKALLQAGKVEESLRDQILKAQDLLPSVTISADQLLYLCEEATRAGCEGQRAEIFAASVAKASAAFAGRQNVVAEDLQTAVLLTILPRALFVEVPISEEELESGPNSPQQTQPDLEPIPPPPEDIRQNEEKDMEENDAESEQTDEGEQDEDESQESPEEEEELDIPAEFMLGASHTQIDPRLLKFNKWTRRGKGGKRSRIFNLERGRYIKPIFPKGDKGRLAAAATLRTAAPYQKFRRARALGTRNEDKLVFITRDDFKIQRLARKAGSLVIFVVDASGSMALNRMDAAKGAALSLLQESYKCRDKICLIEFHGETAQVLVPPTKSSALTKNRLEAMPCGGGSPLTHALDLAIRTGLNTKKIKQDVGRVVIVLLTDGRANMPLCISLGGHFDPSSDPKSKDGVPSRAYLKNEVLACAKQLASLPDFNFLVIDTEDKFVGTGFAKELASVAQGNYVHLDTTDSSTVVHVTKANMEAAALVET